jgi:hypothetical protein
MARFLSNMGTYQNSTLALVSFKEFLLPFFLWLEEALILFRLLVDGFPPRRP